MAFYLQSLHSKLYLQAQGSQENPGTLITQDKYHGRKSQQWKYMNKNIVSKMSNLVLDVQEDEKAVLTLRNETPNQNWSFAEDFAIVNDAGLALDVRGGSKEPGAEIIVFKKHGGTNQQFRVVPVNK